MGIYKQYAQSYSLQSVLYGKQLLGGKADGISDALGVDVDQFFVDFLNLETCNSQGLDNFGELVRYKRTVYLTGTENTIGFTVPQTPPTNDIDNPQNFYNANFWGGSVLHALPDEEYRTVLRLLLRQTISDYSKRSLVLIANEFFNDYAMFTNTVNTQQVKINIDIANNTVEYVFLNPPAPWQANVLFGVKYGSVQYNPQLLNAPLTMGTKFTV